MLNATKRQARKRREREIERERENNKTTKNVVHLLLLDRVGSVGIAWIATVRICLSLQLMLRLLQLLLFHLIDIHTHRHSQSVCKCQTSVRLWLDQVFACGATPHCSSPAPPPSPNLPLPLFLSSSLSLPSRCASLASLCRYALVPTTQSSNRFNAILCNFEAALLTPLPAGDCAVSCRDSISS